MKQLIIVDGAAYPLTKRGKSADSPWWIRVQVNGIRKTMTTGTADTGQATVRATEFVRAAQSGNWLNAEAMRSPGNEKKRRWPRLDEVIKAASTMPAAITGHYGEAATAIASEALGITAGAAHKLGIEAFTSTLARAYQGKCQGLKRPQVDKMTPNNGHANATLAKAKALFGRKAVAHYESLGISIPDMASFLTTEELVETRNKYSDSPIADATLRVIDAALKTATPQVKKAHIEVRCHGKSPGDLSGKAAMAHYRWLKQWSLTPTDIHLHAAAAMVQKTGSLAVAAEWSGLGIETIKWHCQDLVKPMGKLEIGETYLGI